LLYVSEYTNNFVAFYKLRIFTSRIIQTIWTKQGTLYKIQ
jgi:hypothetical protein